MATELCPNEGKVWLEENALSGASLYIALFYGVTIANGDIDALTELASLQATAEENGTAYTRKAVTLGAADIDGIIAIPQVVFDNSGNANWHTETARALVTHATAGVAVYYWDLSSTYNMAIASSTLTISACDIFMLNPGE